MCWAALGCLEPFARSTSQRGERPRAPGPAPIRLLSVSSLLEGNFIEIYLRDRAIYLYEAYNAVVGGVFTEKRNLHRYRILDHFHHPRAKLHVPRPCLPSLRICLLWT